MDKIRLTHFRRSRLIKWEDLFVGRKIEGEVRAEFSDLFQNFYRNSFLVAFPYTTDNEGDLGRVTGMFESIENWCDANCVGLWTVSDNMDEVKGMDRDEGLNIEINMRFELESDLLVFIKDCAVVEKLRF